MNAHTPITDADLHAYVDGALEPARRREVEAWLATHPESAAIVERYRGINAQLHTRYDPVLAEPLPAQLRVRLRAFPWMAVAASIVSVGLGVMLGWTLKPEPPATFAASIDHQLVRPAAFSHRVFAAEKLHPVEVRADQEKHLVEWLSRRLNTDLKAPHLAEHGFALVGGRLLPSDDRTAAQFMYENKGGTRVTLYVRRGAWEHADTGFRYFEGEGVNAFYWVDGPLGYALSGNLDRPELLTLSEAVYRSLSP